MLVGTTSNIPISGREVVRMLDHYGISASSGSACKSGTLEDSLTLKAMGFEPKWLKSGLRLSLGPWLSNEDILAIPQILKDSILTLSSY